MADKGTKMMVELIKSLEARIIKIEKELKSQQDLVKKLVICIVDLGKIVKQIPEKQIRKSMAFKYPFPTKEINLDLTRIDIEDSKLRLLNIAAELEQLSELTISENEEFSLSFDTVEILDSLTS